MRLIRLRARLPAQDQAQPAVSDMDMFSQRLNAIVHVRAPNPKPHDMKSLHDLPPLSGATREGGFRWLSGACWCLKCDRCAWDYCLHLLT